jgi:hypothetical protein
MSVLKLIHVNYTQIIRSYEHTWQIAQHEAEPGVVSRAMFSRGL